MTQLDLHLEPPVPVAPTVEDSRRLAVSRVDGRVRVDLPASFNDDDAGHLAELVSWLLELGPVHLDAHLVEHPEQSDGLALRRLRALAGVRRAVEAGGGTLTVSANPRLRWTLYAMRLASPT